MADARDFSALIEELRAVAGSEPLDHHRGPRASQPRRVASSAGAAGRGRASRTAPKRSRRSCGRARRTAVRLCRSAPAPRSKDTSIPIHGGVSIDMTRMNRILRVSADDLDATVEAGVTRKQLEKAPAVDRAHVPARSRRRCDARRHGGDARVRHDRGALRDDARGGAWADRRPRRRTRDPHRRSRAQVIVRLRPDQAVRRLGGHARRHHRGHAAAARPSGGARGGDLPLRDASRMRSAP